MTVQEIAKKQGYAFALLEREGNGIKVYELISESEICTDGKYKEWVEPVIGIPWYCIVENGKANVVSMMSNEYIDAEQKTKSISMPRGKVAYLKMLYEKYLKYGGEK